MANQILVAYTSKYGATRQYAEWIASELQADLAEAKSLDLNKFSQYQVVVYGGGLYAGGIAGVQRVLKQPCKNLVVFTVGLADPSITDYSEILQKNFKPERMASTRFFHLRGGIDYKQLGPIHKGMMAMMKRLILKKQESERDAEDREFLRTYNAAVQFTDKSSIEPLVTFVQALRSE